MAGVTLIVDDDRSTADGLRHALVGKAAGVEFARDVATAKAMLDTRRFCGLVLDLAVGQEHGLDVLDHLSVQKMAIPTVIVSKKVSRDVREKLGNDVKLVFSKPIEPRLLASVVLGLCGVAPSNEPRAASFRAGETPKA